MSTQPKLKQWTLTALYERIARLELCHYGAKGSRNALLTITVTIGEGDKLEDTAATYAGRLWSAATDDADGIGSGNQKYVVQAYQAGQDNPVTRFTFQRQAENSIDDIESEPANKDGLMAQLMRHNQQMFAQNMQGWQYVLNTLTQSNAAKDAQIEKLTSRQLETVELIESLVSKKEDRELATWKAMRTDERIGEALGTVKLLLPAAISHATGGKMVQNDALIRAIAETLSEEQLEALTGVLKPEQSIALVTVINNLRVQDGAQTAKKPTNGKA